MTLSTVPPSQEEEEVEERASLLAAVYHPSKKNWTKNQKTRKQFNNPVCVEYQSRRVFQFYPSKMAILLTQENMFHHE